MHMGQACHGIFLGTQANEEFLRLRHCNLIRNIYRLNYFDEKEIKRLLIHRHPPLSKRT